MDLPEPNGRPSVMKIILELVSGYHRWMSIVTTLVHSPAIANFAQDDYHPHRLPLLIGDTVIIFQECRGWFYGCLFRDSSKLGIFPVKFVVVKNASKNRQR